MISQAKFFGGAIVLAASTVHGAVARILDVSALATFTLPARTKLNPGGPYFYLLNSGAGAVTVKREDTTTLLTLATGDTAVILLGTSSWFGFTRTNNTATTFGTAERVSPVGYGTTPSTVTEPTSYDPIVCDGGFRRARFCNTGALANIWMTDADVTPNFVSSVAAFTYVGQTFYFKESDSLLPGHGTLIDGTTVSWFATCDDALASLFCDFTNPQLPASIFVRVTDPDHVPGDTEYAGGDFLIPLAPGSGYVHTYAAASYLSLNVTCNIGGISNASHYWMAWLGYNVAGVGSFNICRAGGGAGSISPYIGNYTQGAAETGGNCSGGVTCVGGTGTLTPILGSGSWPNLTVEVLAYGITA